jgi:hypothetical protein
LAIYCALFSVEITLSVFSSGHHLVYPLDDTYISMAMAKHFAEHGVWGVTPFGFTSATSTPLYVLLVATCYRFTGAADCWPLVLAFTSGAFAILLADRILPRSSKGRLIALLSIVLLTPLASIAHLGMEHTLHICLTLLFAWRASVVIGKSKRFDWFLVLIIPLLVMTRFEGLFLVGIGAFLLAIRRSFLLAASLLMAAALPVTAYGALALSRGWFFLPNSLLLKGTKFESSFLINILVMNFHALVLLRKAPHLIGILIALVAILWATRRAETWAPGRILVWLSLLSLIAHVVFADVGWIFRYEAYLIVLSIVSIATALPLVESLQAKKLAYSVAMMAAAVLLVRSFRIFTEMPSITNGIYSQQYQMGRFVSRYYQSSSIAANDIGAINYMADLHLFDLAGLADTEILKRKRLKSYTTKIIDTEASRNGVQIAIVYDSWFSDQRPAAFGGPALPRTWLRVGRWRTLNAEHLGSDAVSFYAVQPNEESRLREALRAFREILPSEVTVLQD